MVVAGDKKGGDLMEPTWQPADPPEVWAPTVSRRELRERKTSGLELEGGALVPVLEQLETTQSESEIAPESQAAAFEIRQGPEPRCVPIDAPAITPQKKRGAADRLGHKALNVALLLLVGLALAVVGVPRATGAVPLTVLTGSMVPTFRPGDLVVVRPTPVEQLRVGDVVTFQPQPGVATLITHRIIDIGHDAAGAVSTIQTKGDANNVADPTLVPDQIMGRVWYSIPLIGHLANGRNILLVASAVGLGLVIYAVTLFTKKDDTETSTP